MRWLLVIALLVVTAAPAFSAEPDAKPKQVIPHAQSVPPGPALSPAEAIAKMTVPEGFKVELVASEPDIINPVSMTFDERGRVWITESIEYPRSSPGVGKDRVKVLEDTDGDGKADKFTIFAEGLNIPSGIAVGYGGVWVANSPDLLFLQDTDGDGKADKQEVVVTGFGRADTHELPNSLTWGPDGWLYGLNGVFNPSKITHKGKTHEFTCAMFRIHPRTRDFEIFCEGTSNPWGIAIDKEGSFFVSACVIDHLWHLVETGYYHRQGGPYPPFTWKIESIVKHKHQKAAYCGIHYFDSDAYPEKYREKLYMGNVHGNCINVDRLERDGSTYRGLPEPDFLAANDAWFMPVVQKTGPDGCLYILDWYDQYHCYQDARRDPAGIDRGKGRLYRVRYNDTPRAPQFDLAKETDEQLIERLKSPNVYYRDVAQRLLSERAKPATLEKLEALVMDAQATRKTRMHALWTRMSAGPLGLPFHFKLYLSGDPALTAWCIRAAGNDRSQVPHVLQHVWSLGSEESRPTPREVQLQVAIAAPKVMGDGAVETLMAVAQKCGSDDLVAHIVWNNLQPLLDTSSERFIGSLDGVQWDKSPALLAIVPRAFDRLLAKGAMTPEMSQQLLEALGEDVAAAAVAQQCMTTLAAKIRTGEIDQKLHSQFAEQLGPMLSTWTATSQFKDSAVVLAASLRMPGGLDACQRCVTDASASTSRRILAFDALQFGRPTAALPLARQLLTDGAIPVELQLGIAASLGRTNDAEVGALLVGIIEKIRPAVVPVIVDVLTERAAWRRELVSAVESKQIAPEAVNVNQLRKLLSGDDAKLIARAKAIWGTVRTDRNPAREQVVYEMRNLLKYNSGDPHKGQLAFNRLCGQCHKIHGQGQDVGPDITVNGRASLDQLLSNVFDPSLVIGRIYQAYTVVTTDGRTLTGLLVEDNPQRIVLKVQGGKIETIARKDVDEFEQSKLSLMPEGVEKQLSPQELIDLLAFLRLDKSPSDPAARPIPDVKK